MMNKHVTLTAAIWQEGEMYVSQCPELGNSLLWR